MFLKSLKRVRMIFVDFFKDSSLTNNEMWMTQGFYFVRCRRHLQFIMPPPHHSLFWISQVRWPKCLFGYVFLMVASVWFLTFWNHKIIKLFFFERQTFFENNSFVAKRRYSHKNWRIPFILSSIIVNRNFRLL